jgi:hypothetical protein
VYDLADGTYWSMMLTMDVSGGGGGAVKSPGARGVAGGAAAKPPGGGGGGRGGGVRSVDTRERRERAPRRIFRATTRGSWSSPLNRRGR